MTRSFPKYECFLLCTVWCYWAYYRYTVLGHQDKSTRCQWASCTVPGIAGQLVKSGRIPFQARPTPRKTRSSKRGDRYFPCMPKMTLSPV